MNLLTRRIFPRFLMQIFPLDWVWAHRIHVWAEYKSPTGISIQLVVEGMPRKLSRNERIFLFDTSVRMKDLTWGN